MSSEIRKTTIGGQAILEGIVMKGPNRSATVVRKPDKTLAIRVCDKPPISEKYKILGWPVVRGIVNLFTAMKDGIEAINFSAQFIEEDDTQNSSKFDRWLEKRFGSEVIEKIVMALATVTGIIMPVGLFILLPTILAGVFEGFALSPIVKNLIEGGIRIAIFLAFMFCVSGMRDMKRTFSYHGAEHKTIHCYEHGDELTIENVKKYPKQHARCGTSFLFVVMVISILVFSLVSWSNPWLRMVLRLLLIPLVVGISYEFSRYAGRHDNWITKVLRAPGMWTQNLTTFEPNDDMIEVAIEALKLVIPEDQALDRW